MIRMFNGLYAKTALRFGGLFLYLIRKDGIHAVPVFSVSKVIVQWNPGTINLKLTGRLRI